MSNDNNSQKLDRARRHIGRQWSFIGLTAVAAFTGLWYAFCLRPTADQLDALRLEIDASYGFLATETDLVEQLQLAAANNKSIHRRLAELTERGAASPDEIAFLGWMSHHSADWSLSLTDYRPGGPVEYGDFEGRSLQLAGRGGFDGICHMLHALRERPQMSRVSALTVTPVDDERSKFDFAIKLELLQDVENRDAPQNGASPSNA